MCTSVASRENEVAQTQNCTQQNMREFSFTSIEMLWLRFTLQDDNNESNDSN